MISPGLRTPAFREESDEDEVLVQKCLLGDEKAWSALIGKYANLIFSIPIRRGFRREDASDIFQSVCAALVGSLGSIREPRALAAWVIQTTSHACDRMQMQQQRWIGIDSVTQPNVSSRDLPDELVRQFEREQLVRRAVGDQSADCQKLIHLLFFSDPPIPYEAAAAELGKAKGSMGATRMRCLEKLRRSLEEKGFR